MDTINDLDDQIIRACNGGIKNNNKDVPASIKTRYVNIQSGTQPLFNHGIINNNLNLENILNHFKESIVKVKDLQASYCQLINVTSTNNLTKPGFPDITNVDDETVLKKVAVLVTGESILCLLSETKMFKRRFIKVFYFSGVRIRPRKHLLDLKKS